MRYIMGRRITNTIYYYRKNWQESKKQKHKKVPIKSEQKKGGEGGGGGEGGWHWHWLTLAGNSKRQNPNIANCSLSANKFKIYNRSQVLQKGYFGGGAFY